MNIKIKKYLVIAILLLTGTFSCTDLDENLYDRISADETKLTAEDLGSIIAPAFAQLRGVYWHWDGLSDLYEESSDLIVTPARPEGWGDYYLDMHKHTWGPGLSHIEALWERAYTGINSCNKAIYQVENIGDAEGKESILAELKALRAFYYYLLYDNFRSVPIVTDFIVPPGFLPEQSTGQEVYDFIESELEDALPLLSDDASLKTYGRFTKWAAKMTLAKLYLNSEIYLGTEKWDETLAVVEEVIASTKFSLTSSYSANFAVNNTNTSEEIFSIPFSVDYTKDDNTYWPFKSLNSLSKSTYNMGDGWNGSCGIPQFIDTYDTDDSRLEETWLGGPQFSSKGDPIEAPEGGQFTYPNYLTSANAAKDNEGFRMVKYEIPVGFSVNPDNDVPLFRYTDALFIKAECLLRKGQADEAAAIVTSVRQRAFKSNPSKATVTGAQLMGNSTYQYGIYAAGVVTDLDAGTIQYGRFLDELAWEFVGEHHRKQDLIRFGVYTTKRWLTHLPSPKGNNIIVFPIPKTQMETNGKLVQNPGY